MPEAIPKSKMAVSGAMMLAIVAGLTYVYGLDVGLKIAVLNVVVGYFYADVRIAISHFLMDNYDKNSTAPGCR